MEIDFGLTSIQAVNSEKINLRYAGVCPDNESIECEILMMGQNNFKICMFCIIIYSSDSRGYSNSDSERDTDSDSNSG